MLKRTLLSMAFTAALVAGGIGVDSTAIAHDCGPAYTTAYYPTYATSYYGYPGSYVALRPAVYPPVYPYPAYYRAPVVVARPYHRHHDGFSVTFGF